MMKEIRLWALLLGLALLAGCAAPGSGAASISGVVRDDKGPVAGATVRVKATDNAAASDEQGRFTIGGLTPGQPAVLTAWAPGYYIVGGEQVMPGTQDYEFTLVAHASEDNSGYEWLSAFAGAGQESNCENCHSDPSGKLPFDQWRLDAHSQTAGNARFLTMYSGMDLEGNQSPPTRYGSSRDYGRFPLRPDPNQPYYGPGYKLDFPSTAGNCAACHLPAAAVDQPYGVDPTQVSGVGQEGVACDFCHKVWDVQLDEDSGMPQPNMPGVLSFELRRPPEGHQFFAGPFDDVAPGEDTYTPVQQQSQYCAPCHFGVFWDTVVYNSFGEWLQSPYSDPQTGKTCQDCHMPPSGADHFVRIERGGSLRDPDTIFSHTMPGAADEQLLQNAVTMTADARVEGGQLVVRVKITNDLTGHHVPTDSPLRQLILLVEAVDEGGNSLALLEGTTIPDWGGIGDPAQGYYAGLPGKTYAKVLEELWTEVSPTGAYWNPTRVVADNRIAAFETASSAYVFAAPDSGKATVEVRLLFRRAFIQLADQKGWDLEDILMAREVLVLD